MRMMWTIAAGAAALPLAAPATAAIPPEALARVDKIFADWRKAANVPGVVYGIVQDGQLVAVKGQGVAELERGTPVGADSLFRIASMSKAFTALAILKLRDEGKVRLDDPAELYVPEMRGWTYPTADSPRDHRPRPAPPQRRLRRGQSVGRPAAGAEPGRIQRDAGAGRRLRDARRAPLIEYSNTGYAILGRIVTNVSGQPYQDYIRTQIMAPARHDARPASTSSPRPAARRAIGYRFEDGKWMREPDMKDGEYGAMGGVETSANDYWRWVAFLLSAWPPRDDAEAGPVKRSTVREIVTGAEFRRRAATATPRSAPRRAGSPSAYAWAGG